MRKFVDKHIELDVLPKKCKKLTGTRFASVLGLDKWNTEFKTWCAITKTYEDPFVDNKYTIAGKTIEPKIINYLNKTLFLGSVVTPTDVYGEDYFKKTWGDFFPDEAVFGGMWDSLVYDDGKPCAVIEIKTTKRAEDWQDGKAPVYYAMQASLYAKLLGLDDVVMVAAFLEDEDYEHPENFEPSVDNTITDSFSVSERFPDFDEYMEVALQWWNTYVENGVSPDFDESKDADILKALRTNMLTDDTDIADLLAEAETLMAEIDAVQATIADKENRLKEVKDLIKQYGTNQFREGDKSVTFQSKNYIWSLAKTSTQTVDKKALEKDGLLDKYCKTTETIKLNAPKLIKEDK